MAKYAMDLDRDLQTILDAPAYSLAETSRLVGISVGRVRRWLKGYEYKYPSADGSIVIKGSQDPVVHRVGSEGTTYASFLDLIDLLFVKQFLRHGHSLQMVRLSLDEARKYLGTDHFARRIFFSSGHNIYLQMNGRGEAIIQLMTGGQWVIAPIIVALAKRIEFDEPTGWARRWFPFEDNRLIVIDPFVSFGRPSIAGKGISTANVYDFYLGEEEKISSVCEWFHLARREASAAIMFEQKLAA